MNKSKVYGAALPTLTACYSGFVNEDTSASLATLPMLSTTALATSHVAGNPYSITASGAVDTDYTISYTPGTLTVTTASLTITPDNQTKAYGAALPTLTASYAGFVNGDTSASLATLPTITSTGSASSHVAGSPYAINASAAVDTDYSFTYVPGNLTITTVPLTITANNQTKVYGAALPTFTASYSGFVNGDTSASLTTLPTITSTATATSHVVGSPYTDTPSAAVDTDYSISYFTGTLTVTTAALTITANNQSKVYGAALPTLTASYTGLVNGDTSASLTTLPTVTTTATASSHVSPLLGNPFVDNVSGAVDTDYTISYVSGTLIVTPAPLTITPDNQSKLYGAALPTLTASYTGLVNGDTSASLTTLPIITSTASASSHVSGSPYLDTAAGAIDPDYTITYATGNLSVSPVSLTITANNQSKVYGAALPTLTASYSGFVNGDTSASLTTPPTITSSGSASSHVVGSPYTDTASGAVDSDYTISYAPGTLSVTTAPLTITADNQTKVYGAALPTLTASYSGFVNGDTTANLTTLPTINSTASATSHVVGSPYTDTASGAVDSDYTISYAPGTLAVTAAPLTITANSQSKVYGAALPTLTASYTGLVNGDTSANLTTLPTITSTASATSHVVGSPYTDTAIGAVDPDYTISYAPGTLAVTTAPLTITANNQSKVYGAALPTLTASYTGLVNGDTSANLTTLPTIISTATATSHVVDSPYTDTAIGAVDSDYTISYAPGSLSVTTAPLTITANNQSKVYGAALPTLTASYTGLVNGDTSANLTTLPTITSTAIATSHVVGSPYTDTAIGAVDSDYTISYAPGSLSVTTAPLTITANNQSKVYGAALPSLTASYSGFVNGDTSASLTTQPTINSTATATSHVAGSPYTDTAIGAVDSDYTISYAPGTLAVTTAPLTITANNQSKVYGAALPTLTASYTGLVNGDTSANLTTQPTIISTATATSHVVDSPYTDTAIGAVDSDYTISYAPGSLSVTTAPLTITANNQSKVYGAALPTLTASYSGFVNGDTSANLTTLPTITSTAIATSHVVGSPYTDTAIGAVDPDYLISYALGTMSVTQALLTITADNQSKVYGAALPTLTASYAGLVNGDTSASLTTLPTVTTTGTVHSHVMGGPYAITATGAVDSDYMISYAPGTLAVTTAPLTITANSATKVYGQVNPSLTVSYSGFVNGDTSASLTTPASASTLASLYSDVSGSPFAITASGAVDSDYGFTNVPGNLSITKAPLIADIDSQTKVYGQNNPTLTGTLVGIQNGDDVNGSYLTSALQYSDVANGGYPITLAGLTGAKAGDYSTAVMGGAVNNGTLIISKAPLNITTNSATKVYGQVNPPITGIIVGILNGDDVVASFDTGASQYSNVNGTYATFVNSLGGSKLIDYSTSVTGGSSTNGILTVTPAPLTVAVGNQSKMYGHFNPTLTGTITGILNSDNVAPQFATTANVSSDVGGYPISVTGLSGSKAGDYSVTNWTAGALTVTPTPLIVAGAIQSKIYGQANPNFNVGYTGFVLSQGPGVLSGTLSFSTTATTSSHVYEYFVTPSGLSSSNYAIQFVNGGLAITPAPLVVTAPGIFKSYGQAIPTLTPTFSGFVNGDTSANLTKQVSFTTSLKASSSVGFYRITPQGATSPDYSIQFNYNFADVIPAMLVATPSSGFTVAGQPLPPLTVSYSGFVNGDTAAVVTTPAKITTTATASSAPGFYNVFASGASAANYNIVYSYGILDVLVPPTPTPGQVAFITSLYANILGRTPENDGLVYWTIELDEGVSQASVAQLIYTSSEAIAYQALHPGQTISLATALSNAQAAEAKAS
jgi:hypothetical protein